VATQAKLGTAAEAPTRVFFSVNECIDPGIGLTGDGVDGLGKAAVLASVSVRSRRPLKT
jgi:hypothetical protein